MVHQEDLTEDEILVVNQYLQVDNYLKTVYVHDGRLLSRQEYSHGGYTGHLLTWREIFPTGPIGDEIWARLTTGLPTE